MNDTRPRSHAAAMLKDARIFVKEWFDKHEVPEHMRLQVMKHLIGAIGKAIYRRKK